MSGAICGFAQSADCAAQSADRAAQSADRAAQSADRAAQFADPHNAQLICRSRNHR